MTTLIDDLAAWLNEATEETRALGPWQVEGPVFRTIKSGIYRATSPAALAPLALKHYFKGDPASQFEALERTWEIFQNTPHFSAPRPWTLMAAPHPVVAMDWIEGPTLEDRLHVFKLTGRTLDEPLRQAGLALNQIHGHSEQGSVHLDTADFLNDIKLAREGLEDLPARVASSVKWLTERASAAAAPELTTAHLHGDFKPANILLGETEIFVIDGLFRGHGPILHDVAQFLNHLSLDLMRPQRLHQLLSRGTRERAFLTALTTIRKEEREMPLSWLRILKLTLMEIELAKGPASPRSLYLAKALHQERARLKSSL